MKKTNKIWSEDKKRYYDTETGRAGSVTEEYELTYAFEPEKVFSKVLQFFLEHECFSGECVGQCDAPELYAADLLADLADDIFEFEVEWKKEDA